MPCNLPQDVCVELASTAKAIVSPGKGILAADESTGTIKKRFSTIAVENTEANRCAYRDLLFTTKGCGKYISGAILFEETLFQSNASGQTMIDSLKAESIIPGIKVDKGVAVIAGTDDEKATMGLDGLDERCAEYYQQGARFAKWRAVLSIDEKNGKPSHLSIKETAHTLARYASICQSHRIVPIVEPEILNDGDHNIAKCADVTEMVLTEVFRHLHLHNVLLEGCLLKPNMVTPGADCPDKSSSDEIAFFTVRTLRRTCPPALGGVTFLSGGQSEEEASLNLHAMNILAAHPATQNPVHPWPLTFSFGRALQSSTIQAWKGQTANVGEAQRVFLERCKANGEAQMGKYAGGAGGAAASASLYEKKYVY